jgi:nicotinate-nucleotide--dimethylbenzimidazole phosphoribosyltransferase
VIESAVVLHAPDPDDPIGVLAAVGGLEIAALVGAMLEAAAARAPVVLDGFITGAAALVAVRVAPAIGPRLLAAHRSVEPGHAAVLARLGLRPVLELDLRLGEGTGAALAIGLLAAACRVRDEMATFESAGVSREVAAGAGVAS